MLRRENKSFQLWRTFQGYQFPVTVVCLGFIVLVALLSSKNGSIDHAISVKLFDDGRVNPEASLLFNPVVESVNGTEVIWQIPDSPKAVLFLAHGCDGRALNFWDKSSSCSNCVGLPEERLIVLHALARKFAVLAISSQARCWTFGEERLLVRDIIGWWIGTKGLLKLPLVALGASSGGYFVSVLANDMRFSSVVLMIAEGRFSQMDVGKDYPPTLFVHMPKDQVRNEKISENIRILRNKGVTAQQVNCMTLPLTPSFLSSRVPGLEEQISMRLYELFRDKGFINAKGYMRRDGRQTPWREAVKQSGIHLLSDSNLIRKIQEELNLAYAYHEMTSLQSDQIFEWFESHMK